MSTFWLAPMAGAGLVLIAVPILIHLLARRESRRVPFPSLRFIPSSTLASLRRRTLADWPLLVLRVLIVVAAVAAAAAPVFVSDTRRAGWNDRYARALVVAGDAPEVENLLREEETASFRAERFARPHLADAIRDAAYWLRAQPPARRELVIAGDVREGAISVADFAVLDGNAGIRFVPSAQGIREVSHEMEGVGEMPDGGVMRYRARITPTTRHTEAVFVPDERTSSPRFDIRAGPDEQPVADALQRAMTREGIALSAGTSRPVAVVFEGAPQSASTATSGSPSGPTAAWARRVLARIPTLRGEQSGNDLLVHAPMRVTDPRAPALVANIVKVASEESLVHLEPRAETAATLARWSRASGPSPSDALPADEGDRRWLWLSALVLLVLEQVMRRRTPVV